CIDGLLVHALNDHNARNDSSADHDNVTKLVCDAGDDDSFIQYACDNDCSTDVNNGAVD
ncbi:hypothetical protein AAVH_32955, partial [Aphelenchoides avenae]